MGARGKGGGDPLNLVCIENLEPLSLAKNFKCAVFWQKSAVTLARIKSKAMMVQLRLLRAAVRNNVRADDSPGRELGCSTNQAARS